MTLNLALPALQFLHSVLHLASVQKCAAPSCAILRNSDEKYKSRTSSIVNTLPPVVRFAGTKAPASVTALMTLPSDRMLLDVTMADSQPFDIANPLTSQP